MSAAEPDTIDSIGPIDEIRLTAYALGELDVADRAAIEKHLFSGAPSAAAARRHVEEVRATARLLSGELAQEITHGLTALQHEVIERHLHRLEHPELARRRLDLRRWTTVGLSAAAAVLIVGGVAAALLPRLLAPFRGAVADAETVRPGLPPMVEITILPPPSDAPEEPALADAGSVDLPGDVDVPADDEDAHLPEGLAHRPAGDAPGIDASDATAEDAVAEDRRPVGVGPRPDTVRATPRPKVFADGRRPREPRDVRNAKVTAVLPEEAIAEEPPTPSGVATSPGDTPGSPGQSPTTAAAGPTTRPTRPPSKREVEMNAWRVNRQRNQINYKLTMAIARAGAAIEKLDVAAARRNLDVARVSRFEDPIVFAAEELREFDRVIKQAQAALDAAVTKAEQQAKAKRDPKAAETLRRAKAAADEERRQAVAALIRSARQLTNERRYGEVLAVIDQVLALDPDNDYGLGVRPLIQDKLDAATP